jgi:hypothetical protein
LSVVAGAEDSFETAPDDVSLDASLAAAWFAAALVSGSFVFALQPSNAVGINSPQAAASPPRSTFLREVIFALIISFSFASRPAKLLVAHPALWECRDGARLCACSRAVGALANRAQARNALLRVD